MARLPKTRRTHGTRRLKQKLFMSFFSFFFQLDAMRKPQLLEQRHVVCVYPCVIKEMKGDTTRCAAECWNLKICRFFPLPSILFQSFLHPPPLSFSSSTSSKNIVGLFEGEWERVFFLRKGLNCCSPLVLLLTNSIGILVKKTNSTVPLKSDSLNSNHGLWHQSNQIKFNPSNSILSEVVSLKAI